jgi:hypothetical protein
VKREGCGELIETDRLVYKSVEERDRQVWSDIMSIVFCRFALS